MLESTIRVGKHPKKFRFLRAYPILLFGHRPVYSGLFARCGDCSVRPYKRRRRKLRAKRLSVHPAGTPRQL